MSCSASLQRGLLKTKEGVGLFHKRRDFSISYDIQVLLGVISQCAPLLHLPEKTFFFPSVWSRREYNWTLNWKDNLLNCFENCKSVPLFPNFTLVDPKKAFLIPISLARNRIYLGTHLTKELIDLFWKLPRYSLIPHWQSRQRMVNTLLLVNINSVCKK